MPVAWTRPPAHHQQQEGKAVYTSVTDLINSTYEVTSEDAVASSELGEDAFLELLIAQLEWQDPLDPMDDTEMVAQLAQFSSLEAQQETVEQLEGVNDLLSQQQVLSATSYIGKEVEAYGSCLSKDEDSVSTVTYTLAGDAADVTAHILDEDGDIVASVELGGQGSGDHSFVWDGLDADGNEADGGQYYIAFNAYDDTDDSVYVSTAVSGTVTSIYSDDGTIMLELSDGRTVYASNVSKIVDTSLVADSTDTEQ